MIYKDGKLKELNAFQVYNAGKNKNHFIYDGIKFFDERPNVFSFFTGYDYKILDAINYDSIKLYLNHVKEVIANGNEELYDYILNWFSYIIQKPGDKPCTCFVLKGKPGCGKTIFTDVLCQLIRKYANKNVNNIETVVGKFNTAIENMKLLVCNELQNVDTNRLLNADALKTVITEYQLDVNQKNEPVRTVENLASLIIVSNNDTPIKIERNDRRYFVSEASGKYIGNWDYFEKLGDSFTENFYQNLFTFFMKRDISEFKPRRLPKSEAREELIQSNKSAYELFIEENYNQFAKGWSCSDCFESYKPWCTNKGFALCNFTTFGTKMRVYCERKQRRVVGVREWCYILKEDEAKNFKSNDESDGDVDLTQMI